MRALWLTDIHLNFLDQPQLKRFVQRVAKKEADALIIAGDIGEATNVVEYLAILHSSVPSPTYFVLGNHDYFDGSILKVRADIRKLTEAQTGLFFLTDSPVLSLTANTAIIGHDGWADGALGDYERSTVELNDFALISELKIRDRVKRLEAMQRLAIEAAQHFARVLPQALQYHRKVLIITHVPPFRNAAWFMGKPSDSRYLPFFASKCTGDVLLSIMSAHPNHEALVLCGHTHGKGRYQPLPNLTVITGDARYGQPKIQGELVIG